MPAYNVTGNQSLTTFCTGSLSEASRQYIEGGPDKQHSGALSPWLLNFSMTLHPSVQITPKSWQFLERSLENTGLNNNSESLAANGQKSFLAYLDICQGKLCKQIVFCGGFVWVWSRVNSRSAVDILSHLGQSTEPILSLFTQGGRGCIFHSGPCFCTQKFPCFYSGWKTFPTQWHAINLVEQLYKICSAIFE